MPATIDFRAVSTYDRHRVESAIRASVATFGGMKALLNGAERVLLKPNLLCQAAPELGVTTHPEVVRAVGKLVQEAGGRVLIGDSYSFYRSWRQVTGTTGMAGVAKDLGAELVELGDACQVPLNGTRRIFQDLELSRHALEADAIINLPKCKTHSQMLLTLGIKNLFGTVSRRLKALWHLKAGVDKTFFGVMLIEIYQALHPVITILDGITGLEGNGPGTSGKARHLGFLATSTDAIALEAFTGNFLGVDPDRLWTVRAAKVKGVGETELAGMKVIGDDPAPVQPKNFKLPDKLGDLDGFKPVRKYFKGFFIPKPVLDAESCTSCGECLPICPTSVITLMSGPKKLTIDYENCLRCGLCVEVCPEDAFSVKKGLLQSFVV